MRISEKQKAAFLQSLAEVGLARFELYLFGSRVVDSKKGGDIDLLLIVEGSDLQKVRQKKATLLAKMKLKTDDERIDLTIADQELLEKDPFLNSIRNSMIRL